MFPSKGIVGGPGGRPGLLDPTFKMRVSSKISVSASAPAQKVTARAILDDGQETSAREGSVYHPNRRSYIAKLACRCTESAEKGAPLAPIATHNTRQAA